MKTQKKKQIKLKKLPSKKEVLDGIRKDLITLTETLERKMKTYKAHIAIIEQELNGVVPAGNKLANETKAPNPSKSFIPVKIDYSMESDSLFCIKCDRFTKELDENGFCQQCFNEENEDKKMQSRLYKSKKN